MRGRPFQCLGRLTEVKLWEAAPSGGWSLRAGTQTHLCLLQDKRAESLAILEESEGKRTKINGVRASRAAAAAAVHLRHLRPALPSPCPQVIASIEERLASLEEETAELAEFSRLDRERRALEYVLYRRGAWAVCVREHRHSDHTRLVPLSLRQSLPLRTRTSQR